MNCVMSPGTDQHICELEHDEVISVLRISKWSQCVTTDCLQTSLNSDQSDTRANGMDNLQNCPCRNFLLRFWCSGCHYTGIEVSLCDSNRVGLSYASLHFCDSVLVGIVDHAVTNPNALFTGYEIMSVIEIRCNQMSGKEPDTSLLLRLFVNHSTPEEFVNCWQFCRSNFLEEHTVLYFPLRKRKQRCPRLL